MCMGVLPYSVVPFRRHTRHRGLLSRYAPGPCCQLVTESPLIATRRDSRSDSGRFRLSQLNILALNRYLLQRGEEVPQIYPSPNTLPYRKLPDALQTILFLFSSSFILSYLQDHSVYIPSGTILFISHPLTYSFLLCN